MAAAAAVAAVALTAKCAATFAGGGIDGLSSVGALPGWSLLYHGQQFSDRASTSFDCCFVWRVDSHTVIPAPALKPWCRSSIKAG